MTLLRISELAERSGTAVSTLRYYERIGLVEPLSRAENGYRLYDDATLERLAFIGRAKRLGMSLDDVATLVEAWFTGECEPLQDRLRAFVTGRIGELRRQIAEESAFERQLERILARLGEGGVQERCGPDCGCDTDPLEAADADPGQRVLACSLADGDAERRILDWRRVLELAAGTERVSGGVCIAFDASAGITGELARLCSAETACCPLITFDLTVTAATVVLTIGAPADAQDLINALFDPGQPPTPESAATERPRASMRSRGAVGSILVSAPAASRPDGRPTRAERTLIA